ncbi:MAG: AAA family ATPase [Desulfobacterales bacterium]|nr:AAA family ATPase [Desulfobacterales bacterium]
MIRAFYGIDTNPFSIDQVTLLPHQQEVFDILDVHSYQGGLCLLMGEPGTGKTMIKTSINNQADKTTQVVNIGRTLHTYFNTIKILCHAFKIDHKGSSFLMEKRLIQEAYNLNNTGRTLIVIIDDAHLMEMQTLRKLRLLFEDFPKNHNVILVGQPQLLHNMTLRVNEDIKSRVTYSAILKKLNPDDMETFILKELDTAGLPHNTFTQDALSLITRSSDGILRKARNLCLSCMIEAVRSRKKTIGIGTVNRVLIQPHWRIEKDIEHII